MAVGAALLGCHDDRGERPSSATSGTARGTASPSAEKTRPFDVTWSKDSEFVVTGDSAQQGSLLIYKGVYQLTLRRFPIGTRWSVMVVGGASDKGTVTSRDITIIKVRDVLPLLGPVPVDKMRDYHLDPQARLEIVRPDGSYAELALPPAALGSSVNEAMRKVEGGPVKFPNEGDADPQPGLSILSTFSMSSEVLGKATTLSDVDAVAVVRALPTVKGTKLCSGYEGTDHQSMPNITLRLKDAEAVVYHRRTGSELARRTFDPDETCPGVAFARRGESKTQDSPLPRHEVTAWLRSLAK